VKRGPKSTVEKMRVRAKDLKRVVNQNLESTHVTQVCIEEVTVDKVLKLIPEGCNIESLRWGYNKYPTNLRLAIPKNMLELGVSLARQSEPRVQVTGVVRNVSSTKARAIIKEIADHYGFTLDKLYVQYLALKKNEGVAVFEYSMKEVRDQEDLRKKCKVLGLVAISRDEKKAKEAQRIVADMGPKDYQCKFVVVEKRAVVCASMK